MHSNKRITIDESCLFLRKMDSCKCEREVVETVVDIVVLRRDRKLYVIRKNDVNRNAPLRLWYLRLPYLKDEAEELPRHVQSLHWYT